MDEEQFGKGAVQSPRDERDYKSSDLGMALVPFDWDKGFDIEEKVGKLPVKNQASTSACGGFAWATLSYVLDKTNREEKSEKFIYAHTHAPGGGSWGRANCDLCVKKGVCAKSLCPLPNPLTEAEIIRTDDISAEAFKDALTNRAKAYISVSPDIESIAQAVRDNGGVVIGITGKNNGTWSKAYPKHPDNLNNTWRHWVYVGKTRVVNGKKHIGILNSWGESVGEKGWQFISEDYFVNDYIWEAWSMVYLDEIPFVFTKTVKVGSIGLEVKMLQVRLNKILNTHLIVDGKFGLNTQTAVKSFQAVHHLVSDGVVGPLTRSELNKWI